MELEGTALKENRTPWICVHMKEKETAWTCMKQTLNIRTKENTGLLEHACEEEDNGTSWTCVHTKERNCWTCAQQNMENRNCWDGWLNMHRGKHRSNAMFFSGWVCYFLLYVYPSIWQQWSHHSWTNFRDYSLPKQKTYFTNLQLWSVPITGIRASFIMATNKEQIEEWT